VDKINVNSEDLSFDIEVYETLEALGFASPDIRETLKELENVEGDDKIKQALKILGQKK
ncbi:MAG TPA: hypothetical protein EYG72_00105, partial [Candidatus Pacebacteria bacterium]|nr:hypothetical protein [Candidatus Paceibacterota bacterium]